MLRALVASAESNLDAESPGGLLAGASRENERRVLRVLVGAAEQGGRGIAVISGRTFLVLTITVTDPPRIEIRAGIPMLIQEV
jgi:hypothetical protein